MADPLAESREALRTALREAVAAIGAPDEFEPELERPRDPEHGDVATNAALVLGGRLGRPPREVAEAIADALDLGAARVHPPDVAGPGFLNFRLEDRVFFEGLGRIVAEDRGWGRAEGTGEQVDVEFVSANPTGPLHVAHGRGAAVGDAVASLLEWTGHRVTREFYVNDAGRQIELLGASVEARWREARGDEQASVPEGGYHGDYVGELARELASEAEPGRLEEMGADARAAWFAERAAALIRAEQDVDLRDFGVEMDVWREESGLYEEGRVEALLERMEREGLTYEEDGAVWLATSRYGDEKDRVLVKSDGSYTYFLPDIAYHLDKAGRGFDRAIDVWGADHHGHVGRMEAALRGLGRDPDWLEVVLLQLVTVLRGGEEVRMSKRAGHFVTLRDLFRETGTDVARYFFLMRRGEQHLNFDLDLALDTSERNPVYKVKYAHARMCSVFDRGDVDPEALDPTPSDLRRLDADAERAVAKALLRFPTVVRDAAASRAPYQLCQYLEELAGRVNAWYHEGNLDASLRVLAEGPQRPARLALARAIQVTLRNGLEVLGVEAPVEMRREEEGAA